jgi:glycine cleavage system regulatory protein
VADQLPPKLPSLAAFTDDGLALPEKSGRMPASFGARILFCLLELVGLDRPGIIREISHVLAAQNVSIAELESERVNGSFSGEAMFKAKARLTLPDGLDVEELRRSLEALADELMVDLSLNESSPLVLCG